jgi:3-oxoacyl-[acyl-carrier-protein] synthase-3
MALLNKFVFTPVGKKLGSNEVNTAALVETYGPVREGFLDRTGFTSIFAGNAEEDSLSIAVDAIGHQSLSWVQDNVDGLVFVTSTGRKRAPGNAHLLQDLLGLRSDVFILDINDACTGFLRSLATASALLSAGLAKNVLVVLSDTYTKLYPESNLKVSPLFSDGASAFVLSREALCGMASSSPPIAFRIVNQQFVSEGSLADHLTISRDGGPVMFGELEMNGAGVFNFVVKHLRPSLKNVLHDGDAEIQTTDVSWYVHQGSRAVVNAVEKTLGIEPESLFRAQGYGNVVGSSIPFQLFDSVDPAQGKKYIGLLAFGVGLTMGATILEVLKD